MLIARSRAACPGMRWLFFVVLVYGGGIVGAAAAGAAEETLLFEKQIRPILKAQCFDCHGEAEELAGGLDLRLVRLMREGGESGPAIAEGDRKTSYLFERISSQEMPPGEKKLTAEEVALIGRWLDTGARTAAPEPEQASLVTAEELAFWSFQPIVRPPVPVVAEKRLASPIDAFLAAKLAEHDLQFSPEADPAVLVRRLYFDLLGLPPTPEQVSGFVTAYDAFQATGQGDDPYPLLVDTLLASPAYGERWGRHWLDVAGYADSDGYSAVDRVRPYAYKYRDYVIRAFNEDKPWDTFLVEQLAGDELVKPPYTGRSGADLEKLIATGFLRTAPDGTTDPAVDQPLARNDVVAETVKIVSTSLMGLSVGCAQCHNHRYDPIPQTDYYRFRALFEPAYDWKSWRASQSRQVSTLTAEQKKLAAEIDLELRKIAVDRLAEIRVKQDELFEIVLKEIPAEHHELARQARMASPSKRKPEEEQLIRKYKEIYVTAKSVQEWNKEWYDEWFARYAALQEDAQARRPVDDFVRALTEIPGKVPPTHLFHRGDHMQPREEVPPGELLVLATLAAAPVPVNDEALPSTGRRLAFARNLTSGRHPLLARVLVNRFWLHHFGQGIVATAGDFGALGEPPSHPELLDWLASEFMENGWSLKRLHRTMLLSTAYRQSSRRTDAIDAVDPDNRLLGRMSVRRLEAEIVRDAVLATSGKLDRSLYGPPVPVTPDESGQVVLGVDTRDTAGRFTSAIKPLGGPENRRSVYVQARRTLALGILEAFDSPEMAPNCEQRSSSTVTPQSLLMMNDKFILQQAAFFAQRLQAQGGPELADQIALGWRTAFGRSPTADQHHAALQFVETQTAAFQAKATPPATGKEAGKEASQPTPELQALTSYCQSLLSSNGFLYVD
ncbi:PSD1 and planctomycete cytochrome C domain-containing protein [Lignipirellula cremea]|uniref:Planctomycete cytochrome C n=1 Tax=Lignipirellula cremea TaxID=2528010 RepID=A0A518E2U5_9BACT|nr:PSD1 and planctomycete cytochrome C domain-containing protein [Lignipirellula cremea]QDU98394.1 Planctomycete cytochrome C [Lignipirellula cremea]